MTELLSVLNYGLNVYIKDIEILTEKYINVEICFLLINKNQKELRGTPSVREPFLKTSEMKPALLEKNFHPHAGSQKTADGFSRVCFLTSDLPTQAQTMSINRSDEVMFSIFFFFLGENNQHKTEQGE